MELSEKIQQIIDRRKGDNLKTAEEKLDFFQKLKERLTEYEDFVGKVKVDINNGNGQFSHLADNLEFSEAVRKANPRQVIDAVDECIKECERLIARFNRDTINISVIGRARQGKSRLIQSISGVDDSVIPADNGGDCTGTISEIANADGEFRAEVVFYNQLEFLEIVQKYFNEIGISASLSSVASFKDYVSNVKNASIVDASKLSLRFHLLKYLEHTSEYESLLGQTVPVTNASEIRDYVAQYKKTDNGEVQYTFKYLAVKSVRIYTAFPFAEAGKINLVDTIGLGDTSLGIKEKMIDTLRRNTDAAIIVRRPDANGDGLRQEDNQLYDDVKKAVGEASLKHWLYFVLNRLNDGSNNNAIRAFEPAIKHLQFANVFQVDCSSKEEVEQSLLFPMLQQLVENINTVDASLLKAANVKFENAYSEYKSAVSTVETILLNGVKQISSGRALDDNWIILKKEVQRQLRDESRSHVVFLSGNKKAEKVCDELKEEILKLVAGIVDTIPSSEVILKDIQSYVGKNLIEDLAEKMRTQIYDMFDEQGTDVISKLQKEFKNRVLSILYDDNGGRLGRIPLKGIEPEEAKADLEKWIHLFIEQNTEGLTSAKQMLCDIADFKLSIIGLLLYKVNRALMTIDRECDGFINLQSDIDLYKLPDEEQANVTCKHLTHLASVIGPQIVQSIDELLAIPHNVFHATARKLLGRYHDEDYSGDMKEIYRKYQILVWPELAELAANNMAIQSVQQMKERILDYNKRDLFVINN